MEITINLAQLIAHIWSWPVALIMLVFGLLAAISCSDHPGPSHPKIWRASLIYLIIWVIWIIVAVLRGINVL